MIKCLIDTGASVSIVSAPLIQELQRRVKVPLIPIAQVRIRGIIPDKTTECKFQAFLDLALQGVILSHTFLVMSRVQYNIIIGADFMRTYGAVIDLNENTVRFKTGSEGSELGLELNPENIGNSAEIWSLTEMDSGAEIFTAEPEFEAVAVRKTREAKIDSADQEKLFKILQTHENVFSSRPGKILNFKYAMQVNNWAPFNKKAYPVAEKHQAQVRKTIREMEDAGIITKISTPFVSPLVIVEKPDGSVRICLDARAINERIIPEYDQAPVIKDVLKQFRNKQYFTSIDLTSSYHHLELDEKTKLLTGFRFDQQTYCYNRLPFGLKTAGCALIRALDRNLTEEVKNCTVRYVDDILLASEELGEHLININKLLSNLQEANFKVNVSKSHFCQRQVLYLGHMLDGEGIRPNPAKIDAITKFPRPSRIRHIRQFLGMCNFFSDHCPGYTETVAPLQELLKTNNRWKWTEESEDAFRRTKDLLAANIKLGYPDFSRRFIIQSDASKVGVGSMLYQEEEGKKRTYLAFVSRKLRNHEKNYTVTELEMLAVIHALQHWRKIVYGFPVLIRTDHKALIFLMKTNMASERVTRWALYVQQYEIELEHCPGKENVIPDALSRNPEEDAEPINHIDLIPADQDFLEKLRNLGEEQKADPWMRLLINYFRRRLQPGTPAQQEAERAARNYNYLDGLLMKFIDQAHTRLRILVPPSLQRGLVWHVHRITGHGGTDKTCATIQETFVWPRMRVTIRDVLRTCDMCQRVKHNTFLMKEYPRPILPSKPREILAIDLFGPLPVAVRGNRYVLVCLDVFSKFISLSPIQKATTKQVTAKIRNRVIPSMGKPEFILSDHGSCFTSVAFRAELDRLGIRHIMSSIRRPQSNPAERAMKELSKFCRLYCPDNHCRWIQVLPIMEECVNSTVHEATGQIPSVVHFNLYPERPWETQVRCPVDARPSHQRRVEETAEHLREQAERRLRRVRNKRFHRPLRVGELVLIKKPATSDPAARIYAKFMALYTGPGEIVRSLGNNSYRVRDLNGGAEAVYNAANLKLYYPPNDLDEEP